MGTAMSAEKSRKRRQYGSGSVFQRKDGMWIGRIEVGFDRDGKRRVVAVSATTEARCKVRLEEKKQEIARNGIPEKGSASARLTVAAWSEQWLAQIVTELRPASYRTTASAVKVWIVPVIGRRRISQLGAADFRAIYAAQRLEAKGQGTLVRTHAVLIKMLKDAAREGIPVPQAALLAKKPELGETDRQAIALDQSVLLLRSALDVPDDDEFHAHPSTWAAALLQGMRQGERLGLTWECVDFEADLIDISWQLQPLPYLDRADKSLGFRVPDGYVTQHLVNAFHLVRPKSAKSRRKIPMIAPVRAALLAWRDESPASPHDLVWPGPTGAPRNSKEDRAEWVGLQARAGVSHPTGRPYVLHEARHATATLLLEMGTPRDVVEAILGQSKLVEAYDHADRLPAARKALEALAEQLALVG